MCEAGCKIGRRHVKTLMRRMGIEALYQLYRLPRTTKPEPGHKIYPYLLRGIEIRRPNQVWAIPINARRGSRPSSFVMLTLRLRFNLPQPGVSIIRAAPHWANRRE